MSKDIFLTNNLTNKKEKFVPLDKNNIRMYVCGPTVYDDPHIGMEEAQSVIDALVSDAKGVTQNWAISESSLPKPAVKVMLNLAHIALDALIRGGTLDIGAELQGGNVEIVVRASGDRLAFDDNIGRAIQGELAPGELSSRTAAAHMIATLAEEMGGGLQYKKTDTSLVMGAVLPQPEGMIG